jgi:hypothetical protein
VIDTIQKFQVAKTCIMLGAGYDADKQKAPRFIDDSGNPKAFPYSRPQSISQKDFLEIQDWYGYPQNQERPFVRMHNLSTTFLQSNPPKQYG